MSAQRVGLLADRYIPYRKCLSSDHFSGSSRKTSTEDITTNCSSYAQLITSSEKRCLKFSKKNQSVEGSTTSFRNIYHPLRDIQIQKKDKICIKSIAAQKILYVQGIQNNYYYSILDYSTKGTISMALGSECYLSYGQKIIQVQYKRGFFDSSSYLSCVKFNKQGTLLYLGDTSGAVNVIDIETCQPMRFFKSHVNRIGCMENTEQWGFLSGSRDKSIIHNDLRLKNPDVQQFLIHKQQVCGLTFKKQTVASGSNDGKVVIWDLRNKAKSKVHSIHQKGAVKALQWCPWKQNLLASGGGSKDQQIVFWNSESEQIQKKIGGKSQVTNLRWRQSTKDIITSHGGFNQSGGYCIVWDAYTYKPTYKLVGHQDRIIGMTTNPQNDSQICTISGDKTLRLWSTSKNQVGSQAKKSGELKQCSDKQGLKLR